MQTIQGDTKRVIIFSMWYYPSHFGFHVDDISNAFEKRGFQTTIVTLEVDIFKHRYFDLVRQMFLDHWEDSEDVVRLKIDRFVDRGIFSPIIFLDQTDEEYLSICKFINQKSLYFFHFFEHFAHYFNKNIFPSVQKASLYYAGNFVSRILSTYSIAIDTSVINFAIDANFSYLYTIESVNHVISGIDFILSQTQSLANMITCSHLQTPAYFIYRPFDFEGVLKAPYGSLRQDLGLHNDVRILIYAGRPSKNAKILPTVLKYVRDLVKDTWDVHLVLVGTQNYDMSKWECYSEQHDHIHSVPFLHRDKLYEYLKAADVLVYPGKVDGHAKIISESQAAKLPVVAFDTASSATNEVIESGVTGILIPDEDIIAFSEAVYRLLMHEDERRRLAQYAFHFVISTQTKSAFIDSYLDLC